MQLAIYVKEKDCSFDFQVEENCLIGDCCRAMIEAICKKYQEECWTGDFHLCSIQQGRLLENAHTFRQEGVCQGEQLWLV